MDEHEFGRPAFESESSSSRPTSNQVSDGKSKKKQTKSILIGVHCSPSQVERLERFIESLEVEEMTRPEAIRGDQIDNEQILQGAQLGLGNIINLINNINNLQVSSISSVNNINMIIKN
jgi:hypothetical protein